MNAVEIEEAVSELAGQPFDPEAFPFLFLEAYGNKETTIKRLRQGNSNKSKIEGGVLQRNNIHLAVCAPLLNGEELPSAKFTRVITRQLALAAFRNEPILQQLAKVACQGLPLLFTEG